MVRGDLHLLLGKDEFLKREFLDGLRRKLFPKGSEESSNVQTFDPVPGAARAALDSVRTAPFLAPKRLAILRRVTDLEEEDQKVLVDALEAGLPATAALVLECDESNAKKDPFLRALSEIMTVTVRHVPFENEMPGWIAARARQEGLDLDRAASEALAERSGRDTASVVSAIEQLRVWAHPRTRASAADVRALFGRSLEGDVFRLVDLALDGNARAALELSSALLRDGTRAHEVVAVLSGQIEKVRRARALLESGRGPADVGQELKASPFMLEKLLRQARKADSARAGRLTASLVTCDESIKTGRVPEDRALERLVLELCF